MKIFVRTIHLITLLDRTNLWRDKHQFRNAREHPLDEKKRSLSQLPENPIHPIH